jgi:hypothetical protein
MSTDTWVKTASTIVGALTSAALVTAAGGAILWTRFHAAQLPADQAVAAVPREELVVVGAVALVGYVIAGLFAVVAVYALDRHGRAGPRTRRGLIVLMVAEVVVAIAYIKHDLGAVARLSVGFAVAGAALVYLLDQMDRRLKGSGSSGTAYAPAKDPLDDGLAWLRTRVLGGTAKAVVLRILALATFVAGALAAATVQQGAFAVLAQVPLMVFLGLLARVERPRAKRGLRYLWGSWTLGILTVAGLVYGAIALARLEDALAVVAAAAAALALFNLGVAHATKNRFEFYGVAVFLSVIMFGSVLSYVRTRANAKLQPVAVLMKEGAPPVCGLYVTENDKRLYLARVEVAEGGEDDEPAARSGRIFWVPRDQVARSALGPLQRVTDAQRVARELRDELAEKTRTPASPTVDGDCSPGAGAIPPRASEDHELARRFQPQLVVDREDGFWPISALTMFELRRDGHPGCRQVAARQCIPVSRAAELPWVGGTGEWIDYPAANTSRRAQREGMIRALHTSDPASTAREYFLVSGGKDAPTSLQYWFYYLFNYQRLGRGIPLNAGYHEGDFESVGLLLSRDSKRPVYVWTARHDKEGRPFAWSEPGLQRTGDHMTFFAARGSHATYEACGDKHRLEAPAGVINDRTSCEPEAQLTLRPQVTPLYDLSFAPWACWEGRFGNARPRRPKAVRHYFASGPRSPLWQQSFRAPASPCAATQVEPERAGAGEETVDGETAATIRAHAGRLDHLFDRCARWEHTPAAGVYVVACNDALLRRFFASGLEDAGDEGIALGRPGGRRGAALPAIYRSRKQESLDGVTLTAARPTTVRVYAACFSGEEPVVVRFRRVPLDPGRPLVLTTGDATWRLAGPGTRLTATPETRARCDVD